MSAIIKNNDNIKRYQLRKKLKIDVPRFNTNYIFQRTPNSNSQTFESVDEILWCDHSNETSSAVLSQGALFSVFYNIKFGYLVEF